MTDLQAMTVNPLTVATHERFRCRVLAITTLIIVATLLFTHLGHYALWGDECSTALDAEGVCATGDVPAIIGHNIVAFERGFMIRNLHNRFEPPLPAYLTALSFLIFGTSAFSARLPFALMGLATFILILRWFNRDRVGFWDRLIYCMAFGLNISLFLYFRQCRYYGCILFFTVLAVHVYLHRPFSFIWQLATALVLVAVLASHFVAAASFLPVLAVDWVLFSRRDFKLSTKHFIAIFLIAAAIAVPLVLLFNPFGVKPPEWAHVTKTFGEKALHVWWNIRDLSVNEFAILPLILIAPISLIWIRDRILLRALIAAVTFFCVNSYLAPHGLWIIAEIRYYLPLLPVCIFIEARTLVNLTRRWPWVGVLLAIPIFGTNVLSGSTFLNVGFVPVPLRSTLVSYVKELAHPMTDPYTEADKWVMQNVGDSESILCLPDYTCYPMMFIDPRPVYAWQLNDPPEPQYKDLPAIHFAGRKQPRTIIVFGAEGIAFLPSVRMENGQPAHYTLAKVLPVMGAQLYRPELFLRCFADPPPLDMRSGAIYILRSVD